MRIYVLVTAVLFALLTGIHVWRIVDEGRRVTTEPFFMIVTVLSAAMCVWAIWLLVDSAIPQKQHVMKESHRRAA